MERITIRLCREVTVMGRTRVRELCAQGYVDQAGRFHLERCIGKYGPKTKLQSKRFAASSRAA